MRAATVASWLLSFACLSARAGTLELAVTDASGAPVADAVVTATAADGLVPATAGPETDADVDQIDKTFVPYVLAVRAGTLVRFPNGDNIRHHVYSFSPAKRFELPLYAGRSAPPVLFDKPGVVALGCNIHDWMLGYVFVADTPYFARSDRQGKAPLRNLPAGDYLLRVWHPDLAAPDTAGRRVHVDAAGESPLPWMIVLNPDSRPRRAPAPGRSGY